MDSMRLSFSTLGCPAWDWKQIVTFAKANAFDAIEVRGVGPAMRPEELTIFSEEAAPTTRAQLEAAGLTVCCLGTSVSFQDPAKEAEMFKEAEESVRLCRRMGIPFMRVFADRHGDEGDVPCLDRNISGLRRVVAMADGVDVLLEVHGEFNTVQMLGPVLKELDEVNFGILWDIQHSDRAYGAEFERLYDLIAPRVRHVHIKDYHRGQGAAGLCKVGEGDIPIERIIRRLHKDGYGGCLSFEWEKRWHPELPEPELAFAQYAKYMKALLQAVEAK